MATVEMPVSLASQQPENYIVDPLYNRKPAQDLKLSNLPKVEVVSISDDASETSEDDDDDTCSPPNSYYEKAVALRSDIQVHLMSATQTSDAMLSSIREVVEKLGRATHEKDLYKDQYDDLCKKRDDLIKRLEAATKESISLRASLLDMSKSRDRAEIECEVINCQLREKKNKITLLKQELAALHKQIEEKETLLKDLSNKLVQAEADKEEYRMKYDAANKELECVKSTMNDLFREKEGLANELVNARIELKKKLLELVSLKDRFSSIKHKYDQLHGKIDVIKEDLRKAQEAREKAEKDKKKAEIDRDSALERERQANLNLQGAKDARDRAIRDWQATKKDLVRDQALLKDTKVRLELLQTKYDALLKKKSGGWQHEREELLKELTEARNLAQHLRKNLASTIEEYKKALEKSERTIKDLREEIVKLTKVIGDRTVENKELKRQNDELTKDLKAAKIRAQRAEADYELAKKAKESAEKELQESKNTIDDLREENKTLTILNGDLTELNKALEQQNKDLTTLNDKLTEDLDAAEKLAQQAERALEERNKTIDDLLLEISNRPDESEELKELKGKLEELECKLASANDQVLQWQFEYELVKESKREADKEIEQLNGKITDLEAQNTKLRESLKKAQDSEAEARSDYNRLADCLYEAQQNEIKALREKQEAEVARDEAITAKDALANDKDKMEMDLSVKLHEASRRAENAESNLNYKTDELERFKDEKTKLNLDLLTAKETASAAQRAEREMADKLADAEAKLKVKDDELKKYTGPGKQQGRVWIRDIFWYVAQDMKPG